MARHPDLAGAAGADHEVAGSRIGGQAVDQRLQLPPGHARRRCVLGDTDELRDRMLVVLYPNGIPNGTAAVFLASDDADHIVAQTLNVDGNWMS